MSKLPIWARKPIHKKEVIATPIGWIVKETGEVLKRVIDLDQKLKSLEKDSISENIPSEVEVKEDVSQESELVVKEPTNDKAESKAKKTTRRTKRTKDKEESTSEE